MRMACSRSNTKILPSPILPVLADFSMASMAWSSRSVRMAASIFTLGRKSTTYSAPRYNSVWPFCRPKPLTSVTVIPCTPMAESVSRTSSSLKGLMIAVINFMTLSFRAGALGGCPAPALERLVHTQHEGVVAPVLVAAGAGVFVRVGIHVVEADGHSQDFLGNADLPVVVRERAGVGDMLAADVGADDEAVPDVIGSGEVVVLAALGVDDAEQVGQGVGILEGQEFPGQPEIGFQGVGAGHPDGGDVAARVVVLEQTHVVADGTGGALVAAVEVPFQAVGGGRVVIVEPGHVGGPGAGVQAAFVGVIEAALQGRLLLGLADAAVAVVGHETHVGRERVRAGGGGFFSQDGAGV